MLSDSILKSESKLLQEVTLVFILSWHWSIQRGFPVFVSDPNCVRTLGCVQLRGAPTDPPPSWIMEGKLKKGNSNVGNVTVYTHFQCLRGEDVSMWRWGSAPQLHRNVWTHISVKKVTCSLHTVKNMRTHPAFKHKDMRVFPVATGKG